MNQSLMSYLFQACGLEVYNLHDRDVKERPLLLARYLATTPLSQWRWEQREHLSSCPTCGQPTANSIRQSHTETCTYLPLCFALVTRHVDHLERYMSREWRTTRTRVALEFGYDPWLIIIATLRKYPDRSYSNAGELVEAIMSLEEAHIPTWNAKALINDFTRVRPLPPTPARTSTATPSGSSTPTPSGTTASGSSTLTPPGATAAAGPSAPTPAEVSDPTTTPRGAAAAPVKPSVSNRLKSLQRLLFNPTPPTPTTARQQELVKEAFDLSLPSRCKVCAKAEATAMIVDCGHVFLCIDCVRTRRSCPVCLTNITDFVKVYRA